MLEDDVGESTEGWKEKWGEVGIRLTRSHADGDDCFDDDPEFFDQLPPLPPFLSDDDDSFLGVEEGDPVLRFGDGDGPPEERETDLTDRFGDEEEVGGVLKGSGRGEGSGELIASEGEEEDSFDDLRGSSREREGRDGG